VWPPRCRPVFTGLPCLGKGCFNRCVLTVVGDRNFDVEVARANGVTSIAVTYGSGTFEEFESARPDHTCDAVEDLLPIFLALANAANPRENAQPARRWSDLASADRQSLLHVSLKENRPSHSSSSFELWLFGMRQQLIQLFRLNFNPGR
jgi:hypothetical protein